MTTPADLLADLDRLGLNAPRVGTDGTVTAYGIPPDLDGQQSLLARCIADLPGTLADEFLAEYSGPEWRLLVLVSTRHAHLVDLVEWVRGRDDVLFLAADRGPTPPAALIIERGPDSE